MKIKVVNTLKIAIYPDDYPGFQPVFDVCEGDAVEIGTPLMHDKNHPGLRIVSPVCGRVKVVRRGDGVRKIGRVIVNANTKFSCLKYSLKRPFLELLAKSGYLAMVRRIDGTLPSPIDVPGDIVISATDLPLPEDAQVAIDTALKAFSANITGKIYLPDDASTTYKSSAWMLDEFMLYKIGKLLLSGEIDNSTFVAVSGGEITTPMLVHTSIGSDINAVLAGNMKDSPYRIRIISDGIEVNEADGFLRYPYCRVEVVKAEENGCQRPQSFIRKFLNFFSRKIVRS